MKVYGHTYKRCPKHGYTDFLIFALEEKEVVDTCTKCLKEAEDFLLEDAS